MVANEMFLNGWSHPIDEYYHDKERFEKPKQNNPKNFEAFYKEVSKHLTNTKFKSRILLTIMDMSHEYRERVLQDIEKCISKSKVKKAKSDFRFMSSDMMQICFMASFCKDVSTFKNELENYRVFLSRRVDKKLNVAFCKNSKNFANKYFDEVVIID
jgi:hypothetical protein